MGVTCAFIIFLLSLGEILVVSDNNAKADVIVILLGSIGDRTLQAIDLYREGYADKIVLVRNYDVQLSELKDKGYMVQSQTETVLDVLRQACIPDSALVVLDDSSRNTIDEAKSVAKWCSQNSEIKSILLVTSSYHSSRAKTVFIDNFKRNGLFIRVLCPLNKYTNYSQTQWFLSSSSFQLTMSETFKWLAYLCWSRWYI